MQTTARTIRTSDLLEMARRELPETLELPASVTVLSGNLTRDSDESDDSRVEVEIAIDEVLDWG